MPDEEEIDDGRQQNLIVTLESPSAARLADLASILQDLRFIVGCCDLLMAQLRLPDPERDGVAVAAAWSAALIAYRRCFDAGVRGGLTVADVQALGLQGEVLKIHKFLHDMRDKHIAHSVNPYEVVRIGAVLSPPESVDRKVEGIATLSMKHVVADERGSCSSADSRRALLSWSPDSAKNSNRSFSPRRRAWTFRSYISCQPCG